MVMAEAVEVAEMATNTDHRVVTATHHQAGKASVVTVAHRILQGNVLHMDRTVTHVVRLVTTVDTVAQIKDHQPLAKELGYTGEAQEVTVPISSIVHSLEGGAPSELL